jgi:hypothetical protein
MSEDFPTLSEVGEENIRAYHRRKGENIFGEPADHLLNYIENEHERM